MSGALVQPQRTISATERCDRCGAQAYVAATLTSGLDLLFCGHHWTEHREKVEPIAMHVHDETHKLLPQAYDPATDNN